jgi:hypothetical protein
MAVAAVGTWSVQIWLTMASRVLPKRLCSDNDMATRIFPPELNFPFPKRSMSAVTPMSEFHIFFLLANGIQVTMVVGGFKLGFLAINLFQGVCF